VVGAAP